MDVQQAKLLYSSGYLANYIAVLPPSIDCLRIRTKEKTKFDTQTINKKLEESEKEIKEIEDECSFFSHKILNDDLEESHLKFKSVIFSVFPFIDENISQIKDEIRDKGLNMENTMKKPIENETTQ